MPCKELISQHLLPERFYHIFNRGNEASTIICHDDRNFAYFLKKYNEKMYPYWDTYAYCILPDHYHLMVKIKSQKDILTAAAKDIKRFRPDFARKYKLYTKLGIDQNAPLPPLKEILAIPEPVFDQQLLTTIASWSVSEMYRRFLLGYSKALRKDHGSRGSLMQKPFRRKLFSDDSSLLNLLRYIHNNGVHHGHASSIEDYLWSSYNSFLSSKPTKLKRDIILKKFGGLENFIRFHKDRESAGKYVFNEPEL